MKRATIWIISGFLALAAIAAFFLTQRDTYDVADHLPRACLEPMQTMTTDEDVPFVRTPEICFSDLPDWPFQPRYVEIDGLRQGYIAEGPEDGEVILMLHGQPAWSYLYRFMIADLSEAGYRVIAMDHLGFGLSDKPVDLDYHSFQNHADRLVAFIDELELSDITLFAQDWGSIIGLYVAGGDLERFDRIIIGNGGLPVVTSAAVLPDNIEGSNASFHRMMAMIPAEQPPFFDEDGNSLLPVAEGEGTEPFGEWVAYARHSEDFQISMMIEALTFEALTNEERVGYDAPFPHRIAMAGPRTFPGLRDELIGITQERLDALTRYQRPFLTIFGGNDPGLVGEGDGQPWMIENIPGAQGQRHVRLPDASHFLQDDRGDEISKLVDAFIRSTD